VHTACPVTISYPTDFMKPALHGTVCIMKAAKINNTFENGYGSAKTIAEKAAWEFINVLP